MIDGEAPLAPIPPMPPLPLADLLAALRSRGLPIGLREHLTVGRLLARWDDLDVVSLRAALAAILARNPREAELVRETFDQLYLPPPSPRPPGPRAAPPTLRGRRWISWLAAALIVLAAGTFGGSLLWSHRHPPKAQVAPPSSAPLPNAPATPPPEIPDTRKAVRRLTAGAAAALVFLWLYGVRTGRQAGRRGRRRWSSELDALPGPQGYGLVLRGLAPPFRSELLDDVAAILGRRVSDNPGGRELDVDRTLRRTLEAGLAPQLVLRAHASTLPILVLEDVGDEMRPFRRRVAALLAGLEARGVHLDRWRFDADADRLFHFEDGAALALRQLLRRRAESPLLVISTGQGIWEGAEGRVAAWVPALRSWRQRTWLHPGTDSRAWRPALAQVPLDVWPMTRPGLLAAARHIARGDSRLLGLREARSPAERAVTPLDVDRLRWLLDLAPRRDPELGELLRQRFCPEVPEAALQEALEAPPLSTRPPLGLADAAVHAFLLGVLDDSRPDQGSAGHERWRLDRALQALGTRGKDEESAEAELAELAASPLAPEVERALKRRARTLPGKAAERLHARVLHPLNRRAREAGLAAGEEGGGGRRWTWPTPGELAAALVGAAVLWLALPFFGAFARDTVPLKPAPPPPRPPASVPSKQASPLIKENGTTPLSARRRERARAVKRTDSPRPVRSKTSTPPSLQVDPPTATTQIPLQAVASLPVPGQAQNPAPQQQPYEPSSGSIVERTGETVHVHLDCGEETSQELTYPLQAGEEFVSATIEIVKNSDMGMTAGKPVYDPEARKVSTTVPLRGPKRADCQIGGDLDFRLRVTVRFYPV